ncbi:nitrogen permease regulator of amino acid transport activity 3-domain-containing protein [Apiospora arundinis]|uniref:Nitrogen permease regulator 3 n=1 Tax=Apiospora arundinis TaxID=335852 RepID=A0ABR2J5V7_9PEZI
MAAPVLPNASNLLGIALVINRSRDGPRYVFHYPAHFSPDKGRSSSQSRSKSGRKQPQQEGDELEEDDDELIDRMTEEASHTAAAAGGVGSLPKGVDLANWNHDDHLETESGSQIVPWEHVAGFPTRDLESLLTPARAYHKRLFQVSLDELIAISYPVYVPENGSWKKKKKKQQQQQSVSRSRPSLAGKSGTGSVDDGVDNGNGGKSSSTEAVPSISMTAPTPQMEVRDLMEDAGNSSPAPPDAQDEEKKSGMTMFNLVFMLDPKKHEAKELVDTLYLHIIKKINKAYKYAQQRSDFVWKESKKILALKEKGREEKTRMSVLWRNILESSSLAASMQDIYEAVTANRIAVLQLETPEGTVTHSVQIPMPFYLSDLPSTDAIDDAAAERFKGLWITTANTFGDVFETGHDDPSFLDKTFALLLLQDEKKIIAELQADPDDTTAAMIEFVRLSKPTTSFHAIGAGTMLSPAQVRRYAQHFIFWRRAIAIPPLHARDVYILSPNCDTMGLPQASQAWARAFPLAPPLPNFLAEISAAPRPYKWFAPSKNHRPTYLQMLAWLMRGGWVTQLCTFAYVVVWPEIQYEVEYQAEADEIRDEMKAAASLSATEEGRASSASTDSTNGGGNESRPNDLAGSTDMPFSSSSNRGPGTEMRSPRDTSPDTHSSSLHQHLPINTSAATSPLSSPTRSSFGADASLSSPESNNNNNNSNSANSASMTTTANEAVAEKARLNRLADRESRALAERAAHHARKPVPQATAHPSLNTSAPHLAHLTPYIIADAKKATGKDSLYLSAIARRFPADSRVRTCWPVFWKYFNGHSALERVALLEDMKRKEAWAVLGAMSEYLVCVRHW